MKRQQNQQEQQRREGFRRRRMTIVMIVYGTLGIILILSITNLIMTSNQAMTNMNEMNNEQQQQLQHSYNSSFNRTHHFIRNPTMIESTPIKVDYYPRMMSMNNNNEAIIITTNRTVSTSTIFVNSMTEESNNQTNQDDETDDEKSNKKKSTKKNLYVMSDDNDSDKKSSPCKRPQPTYVSPNCNVFHEYATDAIPHKANHLGSGGRRDAWKLTTTSTVIDEDDIMSELVLKTSHFGRVSEKGLDLNRKDALVAEALSGSPNAVDIYGFCGESLLLELATYGDLYQFGGGLKGKYVNYLRHNITSSQQLLQFAYQAAVAVRDVHAIKFQNYSRGIQIHRDVRPWNFLVTTKTSKSKVSNTQLKIHDFNAGRFMLFDDETKGSPSSNTTAKLCPWKTQSKCNQHRSPEECLSDKLTEKVDVWGLGNVFYYLYTRGRIVYQNVKDNLVAASFVKKGITPFDHDLHMEIVKTIKQQMTTEQERNNKTLTKQERLELYRNITSSFSNDTMIATLYREINENDVLMKVLYHAIQMCHTIKPKERPSAQDVVNYLQPYAIVHHNK